MEIILKILPIALIFFLGILLRYTNLAKKEDGDFLLKLNFYVALPALSILSLSSASLSWHLIYFPLIGIISILATYLIALIIGKNIAFNRQTFGVFVIGSMIINTGFSLPFLIAAYGQEGLIRKIIFDLGSDTMTYTFMYYLACKYGHKQQDLSFILKKIILSPILFSFLIGILLNIFSIHLPEIVINFLKPLSNLVIALILIALGIYFNHKLFHFSKLIIFPMLIRTFGGLILGIILVSLFGLVGVDRNAAIILSSAPIGYMTLTLASLEKLDVEYAATIVSVSVFSGIFYIPLLILLLSIF